MPYVFIEDLAQHIGEQVTIRGWVRTTRKQSSKLRFIVIRDGSGDVQAVAFKPELGEEDFEKTKILTLESSLTATGLVKAHPTREGEFELHLTALDPIQIGQDYPIGKKEHGTDFLLSNRHLWIRSKKQWATLRLRHQVYQAVCNYLHTKGFIRFDSPILSPNACEGSTTLFELPYFDLGNAYLSQSGQLYLETGAMAFGRVYDFGPVFRAEKSKTRKHLTEFWMMDAEMAFCDHEQNMQIQEGLIRSVIQHVLENCKRELEVLERDVDQLKKADAPFARLTHAEAVAKLNQLGSSIGPNDDLGAEDEALITKDLDVPVFIERWPAEIKAFYMKRDPENKNLVLGSDLIAPAGYGEVIGGSQREDDYDLLLKRMQHENLPMEEYEWFLDLRRWGSVPHSGFGIGLERLVAWMGGISHIREAIPFPRMIYRLRP